MLLFYLMQTLSLLAATALSARQFLFSEAPAASGFSVAWFAKPYI